MLELLVDRSVASQTPVDYTTNIGKTQTISGLYRRIEKNAMRENGVVICVSLGYVPCQEVCLSYFVL